MLKSKYSNPLESFVSHGTKTPSGDSHSYSLLIDEGGQCVIKQTASDQSTILFCEMPQPTGSSETIGGVTVTQDPTKAQIASAINSFWTGDISEYSYVYLFQLQ